MTRTVSLKLEDLDRDTQAAARDAARRSGVSPEAWIKAALADRGGRPASSPASDLEATAPRLARPLRSSAAPAARRDLGNGLSALALDSERRSRETAAKTAAALDSVTRWIERAETRFDETSRSAAERQEHTAVLLGEALGLLTRRLDDIERKVVDGHQPSVEAALRAVERIETQLALAAEERGKNAQNAEVEGALRGFEERIAQIGDRIAQAATTAAEATTSARPIGRRGLDPRDEVQHAVVGIRARQNALEAAVMGGPRRPTLATASGEVSSGLDPRGHDAILLSLKGEIARLADQFDTARSAETAGPAIRALHEEIERVGASVAGLATRDEVGAIERSLQDLLRSTSEGQAFGHDIGPIAAAMDELRAEVRRLSDMAGDLGAPDRLAREIEALARKLDRVADGGADPAAIDLLERQLAEMREMVRDAADPRRVHVLSDQIAALASQVAEIVRGQGDARVLGDQIDRLAAKLDALNERGLATPDGLGERIEALTAKLDALAGEPDGSLKREIERLSARVDSALVASVNPLGLDPLIDRLDRLDASLRRPLSSAPSSPDLRPIEDMLRTLAERLEQAERPGAGGHSDALDGLEKQITAIATRLERAPETDPALASLERAMGDLMAQVDALRAGTMEATERAVKSVVASTLDRIPSGAAANPDIGVLKRDLADFKDHHSAADKRTHDTLAAVHTTLEKLVVRLTGLEHNLSAEAREAVAPPAGRAPAAAVDSRPTAAAAVASLEAIMAAVPVPAARATQPARSAPAHGSVFDEADRPVPPRSPVADEILLEPGAGRPRRVGVPPVEFPTGPADPVASIKADYIARARRAIQAATAEADASAVVAAATAPSKAKSAGAARPAARDATGDAEGGSSALASRVKQAIDRRRRPLLMGLAAVVLALGAVQVGSAFLGGRPDEAASTAAAPSEAAPQAVEAPAQAPAPAKETPPEPRTTQAIPPKEVLPEPAPVTPKIPTLLNPRPETKVLPVFEQKARIEPAASPGTLVPMNASTQSAPAAAALQAIAAERIPNMAAVEVPTAGAPQGLRQAALNGEPAAVHELAARALDGRGGLARDPKLAAKLFEKAAAFGLAPAQYRIGMLYEKGTGVTRDLNLARAWYQRAAEKGNARAMHNLAVLLAQGGETTKPDYAAAAEWFRRAAEHGVRDSQFNLAVLLARGLGGAQDLGQSYTWFAVAAAQGDDDAAKKRDEVGGRMNPTDLAAAKAAAEKFRPEATTKAANEVELPANGWPDPAPAAAPVKRAQAADKRV